MVDSHCHLDFPDYQGDFQAVLERTRQALEFVVNVGTDIHTSERTVDLAVAESFVYASVGIHPHDASTVTDTAMDRLMTLAKEPKVVAIGECGLDYSHLAPGGEEKEKEVQRGVFRRHIRLARELKLPLIIHCRDAYDDLLAVLKEQGRGVRGVVHCFLGTPEQAKQFLDLGLYVSFTGIITFKNAAPELLESVQQVPTERMMVETDAPFLAPVPHRGKRNEPAYVTEVAKKVAELKGIGYAEVDQNTTQNARALFGIS